MCGPFLCFVSAPHYSSSRLRQAAQIADRSPHTEERMSALEREMIGEFELALLPAMRRTFAETNRG